MLVILDNAADEAQIGALLPGSASCGVLVTSWTRRAFICGTQPLQLGVFADGAAIAFLGQAIGPERVEAEPEYALELVRKCGGLPLALRIAAARLVAKPHGESNIYRNGCVRRNGRSANGTTANSTSAPP